MEKDRKDYWGVIRWEKELAGFWERAKESEGRRGKRRMSEGPDSDDFDGDIFSLEKQDPFLRDRP